MAFALLAAVLSLALFAAMLACVWAGRRAGQRPGAHAQVSGPLDTAVFGLFGLLVAFTFSGASARFDARRALVVREANAMGTTWLRLDLLPEATQPEVRDLLRRYGEARLAVTSGVSDGPATAAARDRVRALQGELWTAATTAARQGGSPAILSLLTPPLNELFDIAATRAASDLIHPPQVVYLLLFGLALAASWLAGLATAQSPGFDWTRAVVFAGMVAAAVYVILDLEYPRLGLIRVDAIDQVLAGALESMRR